MIREFSPENEDLPTRMEGNVLVYSGAVLQPCEKLVEEVREERLASLFDPSFTLRPPEGF